MNQDSINKESVVVAGIGLVSPLGVGRDVTWARLLNGDTGIQSTPDGLEASVIDFSRNGARSRTGDFALLAAAEALDHAGLDGSALKKMVVGCAVSQSKPILSVTTDTLDASLALASFFGWSVEAVIRRQFDLHGPASNVVSACATGVSSLELGRHWILSGQCEIALVGAAESSLMPLYRAGFKNMGVLAHGPTADVVRPFDRHRSGFAMGEGAAVMVLEHVSSAAKRNRRPLAILSNTATCHSATDAIRFDPDGKSVAHLIGKILKNAAPPDYINAHGTATRFNDEVETRGLKLALGKRALRTPVSSTKAATGHLLGAAGAMEAAFCVLALRDQKIPPTLHLTTADPVCDLDYVTSGARSMTVNSALSLSYGFGGQMGAALFHHYES